MGAPLTATASIVIAAHADKIWQALTDPEQVKKYMFGTTVVTDWKVGSPVVFKGEWEGAQYEDKGKVKEYSSNKRLSYSYWSSMGGTEDKPENYADVTYELSEENGKTKLTISQTGAMDEASRDHSQENWNTLLKGIKKQIES